MENAQRYILTLVNVALIVLALASILWLMVTFDGNGAEALIALFASVVGALVQQHSTSQAWWFGTTKGTSDTTAVVRDIAMNKPPPGGTVSTLSTETTQVDTTSPPQPTLQE